MRGVDDLGNEYLDAIAKGDFDKMLIAWRLMRLGDDGLYYSPQQTEQPPVKLGKAQRDVGVGESLLNRGDHHAVRTLDDLYLENYGGGMSLKKAIEKELMNSRTLEGDYDPEEFMDVIFGGEGTDVTYLFNPASRDRKGRVIINSGPYRGLHFLGHPHGAYAILQESDFHYDPVTRLDTAANQHNKGNVNVGPLARDALRRLHRDNKTGVHEGRNSPLSLKAVEDFKKGALYKGALTEEDKKILREELARDPSWRGLMTAFKSMELSAAAKEKDPRLAAAMKEGVNSGLLSRIQGTFVSPNFFEGKAPRTKEGMEDPGFKAARDFMHDKLVEALMRTMKRFTFGERGVPVGRTSPDSMRLLIYGVPLKELYGVDKIMKGEMHGHRDHMNDLVAGMGVPLEEVGSVRELLGRKSPIRDYWILRQRGASGAEAWDAAMKERFGDIKYLISDEEAKEVRKGIRRGLEPLLRQRMIVNGIMAGVAHA